MSLRARCLSNQSYLIGEGFLPGSLTNLTVDSVYRAEAPEQGWIRVWDDWDEDYLYPIDMFSIEAEL